ncbi:hypothetical protein GWI33_015692 [Rhynchophorus ferrugineus]|uniref:Uncharacterized protein n=1 Tax=Rhynchophorus ferrugineus TaxID=354439 RepID=A0A834I4W7_RHYFE|nr:hypothetical protein GWI33_015692 [Rhynchophorus ferrugineus]
MLDTGSISFIFCPLVNKDTHKFRLFLLWLQPHKLETTGTGQRVSEWTTPAASRDATPRRRLLRYDLATDSQEFVVVSCETPPCDLPATIVPNLCFVPVSLYIVLSCPSIYPAWCTHNGRIAVPATRRWGAEGVRGTVKGTPLPHLPPGHRHRRRLTLPPSSTSRPARLLFKGGDVISSQILLLGFIGS